MTTDAAKSRKSAFITGASKGIGEAVAQALVGAGYAVTITSRSDREITAAAEKIGQGTRGVVCDVKDPAAVQREVDAHVAAFGGLDVLFVNAGVGHFANVEDMTLEQWQDVIDTNLSGAFYTIKAAIPALKAQGGYIFTLSSLAGKNPFAGGGVQRQQVRPQRPVRGADPGSAPPRHQGHADHAGQRRHALRRAHAQ